MSKIGALFLSLAPFLFGVAWGINETHNLTAAAIQPAGGFMYSATVPPSSFARFFEISGDSVAHPRASGTRLSENGRRLGPPHRPLDFIRDDGQGQFSHWDTTLYFATSDNSDPRTNGRTYTIVTAARLPAALIWFWGACLVLSTVFLRPPATIVARVRSAGRTWTIAASVLFVVLMVVLIRCSLDPASDSEALRALWAAALLGGALFTLATGQALSTLRPRSIREARDRMRALSVRVAQPFTRPGWRSWTLRSATLLIPFIVFAIVVRVPWSPQTLSVVYTSTLPIVLPAGLALWCCHLRRDWIGLIAALTATLALFALPLAALWQHVVVHPSAVGGLLPYSDARVYYYDASRLLEGIPLGWSARRPLFVGLLSTVLALTGQNLQLSVAILVVVNAVAAFLLARELRISNGPVAAAVATLMLFFFYRRDGGCGTTLTENLGFALGTVAFAVIWRAGRRGSLRGLWLGIALLTLALMARAGAFFVLPALAIAAAWVFRDTGGWHRAGGGAVAAMLIAAALSLGVGRALADPSGTQTAFSNFSYSLYGLVVGGKGWQQIIADHPGAREGGEMYGLAFQAFRADPMGIVEGSLRMWRAYLWPSEPYNAFAFVRDPTSDLFQNICYFSSAFALVLAVRRRASATMTLLVAATAGHIASIPFVPPIDGGPRVYAATMPILAILVSVGVAGLVEFAGRLMRIVRGITAPASSSADAVDTAGQFAEAFGVALAMVSIVGPVCVLFLSRSPVLTSDTCQAGAQSVHVRLLPGSFLRIIGNVPDVDDTRASVPEVRERDVAATAGIVELKNDVVQYTAGHTMVNTYDRANGRLLWLIAPTDLLPVGSGVIQVCGHDSGDPLSRGYGVFHADTVRAEDGSRSTMWSLPGVLRASAQR